MEKSMDCALVQQRADAKAGEEDSGGGTVGREWDGSGSYLLVSRVEVEVEVEVEADLSRGNELSRQCGTQNKMTARRQEIKGKTPSS